MRYLLAAVHAEDWLKLGAEKLEQVFTCGIYGIDIRVALPARGPSKSELALAKAAHARGLGVRCHAWAGVRSATTDISVADAASGKIQGTELAVCADLLDVTDLASGNFERDVWRGPNRMANPKAVDFIDAYIDAFLVKNRACNIGDLGFADPDVHYVDADLDHDGDNDDELPEWLVQQFFRRGIMAYQSAESDIRKKLEEGRKVSGGRPLSWWGSVGRIDKATQKPVGSAAATRAILASPPKGVDEWVAYVGFGAIGQLLDGNPRHPSLASIVRQMKTGGMA